MQIDEPASNPSDTDAAAGVAQAGEDDEDLLDA